ncbi:nephrin-like [Artemia franciscana]
MYMSSVNLWTSFGAIFITSVCSLPIIEEEDIVPLEVLSVVRGKAEIPCDAQIQAGDSVQLVLWYKDDSMLPIYSYDARGKPAGVAKHWSDEYLGRRAFFRLLTDPATLVLDNVVAEDSGMYRCRVDFRRSKTKNTEVNLTVIVPPQTPKVFDESGREVSDRVGPYEERQSVKLTCYSSGGKPEPKVEWFKNGHLIDPLSEVVTSVGVIQNVLVIPVLRRSDFGSQLSCEASNTNLTLPPRKTVTLDMNLRPLTTKILSSRQPLTAGRRYDITCQAAGSKPPAVITWWKNGEMLRRTKEMIYDDGNVTTSQLTFIPTISDDGKALQCHAENTALTDSSLKDSWIIDVLYAPDLIATLGRSLDPNDIKEGDDVYFECHVKAKPEPFRLGWKKDGVPLTQNISAGVIISDRSLVLQRISRTTGGMYSCYAANSEGESTSDLVRLRVKHRPACKPRQQFSYGAAKLLTTLVSCSVDAHPLVKSFRWMFNSSDDQLNLGEFATVSKDGSTSILRYTPKSEYDYGAILCWAENEIGLQDEPCVFTIYPAGPPDAPKNCTLTNDKSSSMEIECQESFNGGLEQHFVLEIFESHSKR